MKVLMQKGLKTLGLAALAGVLALSSLGSTLANSHLQQAQAKQGVFGTVTAKSESSITLTTNTAATLQMAIDAATQFRAPGQVQVSLNDLALGSRVAVLAQQEAGALTALKVSLVPGEPRREHRVLTVLDISGNTVIAEDAQGSRVEVELEGQASADLRGQLVTFIGQKSRQSNQFKANVEVKIGQIVQRLEAHAKTLDSEVKVETNTQVKAQKEQALAEIKARLEANLHQHIELFTELIARAPVQAKASLEAALNTSLQGYKTALEVLGQSQAQIDAQLRTRAIQGTVEGITTTAGQVTIMAKTGTFLTVKVAESTNIVVNGQAGALADLDTGDQVTVRFNATDSTALDIHVKAEGAVEGTVQSVDTVSGKLTVLLPSGATLTVNLSPSTAIEVNGRSAMSSDLQANGTAKVTFNLETKEAIKVEAKSEAMVKGTLKAVNPAAGTVTILTQDGAEVVLNVKYTSRIEVQGLLAGLVSLAPGLRVEVHYNPATMEVTQLKGEAEASADVEATATGTITSVNAATGEVTIDLDTGGTLTLQAAGKTGIVVAGQNATLADLKAGARTKVSYNVETKVASEIVSSGAVLTEVELDGTLKAVDSAIGKVAIELRDGSTKELILDSRTVILVNGQQTTAADLKAGMQAEVRVRTDTQTVLRVNATAGAQGEVRGKVKSVNLATSQVTIEASDGRQVIVTIDGTTRISKDGRLGLMLDITPGVEVRVQLKAGVSGNIAATLEILSMVSSSTNSGVSGQAQGTTTSSTGGGALTGASTTQGSAASSTGASASTDTTQGNATSSGSAAVGADSTVDVQIGSGSK